MAARLRGALAQLGWWAALTTPGPARVLAVNALVDSAGTGLAAVCLPFFVLRVAQLPASGFAAVLTAGGMAELLAAVPAGVLAGRFGVWRYSTVTRVGRFAGYVLIAFSTSWWPLLALSVVIGLLRAGGNGLNQSMTAAVVDADDRIATLAVTRAVRNIGYVAAGGLGALVLVTGSAVLLRAALVANGLSFLAGALLLARIRRSAPAGAARVSAPVDFSVLRDGRYAVLVGAAAAFASTVSILNVALPLIVLRSGLPPVLVAGIITMNTVLVVLLQHRLAARITGVRTALRGLRRSAAFLTVMALLLAVTPGRSGPVAIVLLGAAGLLLTWGEMTESPAWWTLSFELAPPGRSAQYLAAFDVNYALLNIVGPPLLVLVVAHGAVGWLGYAAAVLVALALVHACVRRVPAAEFLNAHP